MILRIIHDKKKSFVNPCFVVKTHAPEDIKCDVLGLMVFKYCPLEEKTRLLEDKILLFGDSFQKKIIL